MSDDFIFADDGEEEIVESFGSWKILVVDDEPEVHAVTKLALSDFTFLDKRIEFVSAYSGEEAKRMFEQHPDIAMVLLDVVMETDDAGLRVAEYIRTQIGNKFTRIILRTGQPGQAPEKDVILNYDINDYKSKTELTAQKLFTVVVATLRSYRDIMVIEENRQGLEKIITASANLFTIRSLEQFIEGILQQLTSLLGGTTDAAYLTSAVAAPKPISGTGSDTDTFYVFTGKGEYHEQEGRRLQEVVSGEQLATCREALNSRSLVYGNDYLAAYCSSKFKRGSLLYLSGLPRKLTSMDKSLIELFTNNVQIAFDNVLMSKEIEDTQKEIVDRLGQAIEEHCSPGKHVQRIIGLCELLARKHGLSEQEIELMKLAVPLHDVGRLRIPEDVLNRPGALSEQELEMVRRHAIYGYELLKGSVHPMLQTAALMAKDRHEHWDGSGMPAGIKGKAINIFCRIASIAEVLDALCSQRSYKEAWSFEKAMEYMQQESGKHFDPYLIELLMAEWDEVKAIILGS